MIFQSERNEPLREYSCYLQKQRPTPVRDTHAPLLPGNKDCKKARKTPLISKTDVVDENIITAFTLLIPLHLNPYKSEFSSLELETCCKVLSSIPPVEK